MRKFAKAMFISGMAMEILSLTLAVISLVCWRGIFKLFYAENFTGVRLGITEPYFYCMVFAVEIALAAVMLYTASRHFKENRPNIVGEIIIMAYGAILRGVFIRIGSAICRFMYAGDALHRNHLEIVANSYIMNLFGFITGVSAVGISLMLIGCGVSVAIKTFIKKREI